jgi:hypothetical protein
VERVVCGVCSMLWPPLSVNTLAGGLRPGVALF